MPGAVRVTAALLLATAPLEATTVMTLAEKTYVNEPGDFCGRANTHGFPDQ